MFGSVGDELRGGFHVAVRDAIAFLEERAELREQALDLADLGGRASTMSSCPCVRSADAELRLEVLEILVVGAEQRFNPVFGKRDSCHVSLQS